MSSSLPGSDIFLLLDKLKKWLVQMVAYSLNRSRERFAPQYQSSHQDMPVAIVR